MAALSGKKYEKWLHPIFFWLHASKNGQNFWIWSEMATAGNPVKFTSLHYVATYMLSNTPVRILGRSDMVSNLSRSLESNINQVYSLLICYSTHWENYRRPYMSKLTSSTILTINCYSKQTFKLCQRKLG